MFLLVRHKKVPELHHAMAATGFNIECRDENGNTPLITAAQNGEMRTDLIWSTSSILWCCCYIWHYDINALDCIMADMYA